MAEIVLDKVTKLYPDGVKAVSDVDITIADGEFVILVGPSGCGKSTTLNMVAGLEDISSGELRIAGKRVNEIAPKDRDIAMVFQSYALYPHMTVAENIAFPLTLKNFSQQEISEKVRDVATLLDLNQYLDRKPANLSGGQRQRVAMGRAIVRNPKVFLMDEPLSNLDAKLRVQMRSEIARLQRRLGTTTLYVTHDQTEAMTLGDRVVVLNQGAVQQVAPPQELYAAPHNVFVAGFIGSPAMNFIKGRLTSVGVTTEFGDFTLSDRVLSAIVRRNVENGVIIGIRPENFEDAALIDSYQKLQGVTLTVETEIVESMGSHKFVYFSTKGTKAGAQLGSAVAAATDRSDAHLVARVASESAVVKGGQIQLWCDSSKILVFDESTGENLAL
ncbi:MAG: ABC transporter ATP-binding protein [Mycobacteriaceae bacterium]